MGPLAQNRAYLAEKGLSRLLAYFLGSSFGFT